MSNKIVTISGTGCALADFLYPNVRFQSQQFIEFASKQTGDGGLSPGKLVFTDELEKFAQQPYLYILSAIIGKTSFNSFNVGGPALVSLINASQLLPKNNFEVSYYGCYGNDEIAKLIISIIKKTPLNFDNYIKFGNERTAFTDVLSDPTFDNGNGERSFINNIGASLNYTPQMLPKSFFESDIVCFGGTALVPQIHDNLTSLLQKAKSNHCVTVVNTVYDFKNEKANPNACWPLGNTAESFKLIDLLIMDCEEAIKISGTNTINDASEYFKQQGVSAFIITNGSKNVFAYSNGNLFKAIDITQFPISEVVKNELENNLKPKGDTTGCGDNFAGGVIASVAMQLLNQTVGNFNIVEALAWGVASGGFTCFYLGGTYIEKTEGEKLNIIADYQNLYLKQIE